MKRNYNAFQQSTETNTYKATNLAKARAVKLVKRNFLIQFPKGYKFTSNDRNHILHSFYQLQSHETFKPLRNLNNYNITALLFGCSENTVKKVIRSKGEYSDLRKNRTIQEKEIPIVYRKRFLSEIKQCLDLGKRCTAKNFKKILQKDGIEVSSRTVVRKLNQWGLQWGRLQERDVRRKKEYILNLRKRYLAQLKILEEQGFKNRIYLDESFIHENHSLNKGWFDLNEGKEQYKPSGLGRRIAIQGAITTRGWLGMESQHIKDYLSIDYNGAHVYKSVKYWPISYTGEDNKNVTNNARYHVGEKEEKLKEELESIKKRVEDEKQKMTPEQKK